MAGLILLIAVLIPKLDRQDLRKLLGSAQDATPFVLAVTSAVVVLGLYHSSNLQMDFVNRFQWQLLFPVVLVALARPLGPALAKRADKAPRDVEPESDGGTKVTLRFTAQCSARPLPTPAEFWALLAIIAAVVTSLADEPARLSQIAVTGAVLVAAVAVILRVALNNPAATVLAAVALAVILSAETVGEWVTWSAYRIRLQYAHQALGQVINAAPFGGAVAIADAGVLPFKIHQPAIDLGGLASVPVAHGTLAPAGLDRQHLDMVVALSGSPAAGSQWSVGTGEPLLGEPGSRHATALRSHRPGHQSCQHHEPPARQPGHRPTPLGLSVPVQRQLMRTANTVIAATGPCPANRLVAD